MNLAGFLKHQMEQRGWSLRDTERETGLSRSTIDNILKVEGVVPSLDTLAKLAIAFNISLARIIELCGFELGDAHSVKPNERLNHLLASLPQMQSVVDRLMALNPEDMEGILDYIEVVERRRKSNQKPS